jgi:hypothetical protein
MSQDEHTRVQNLCHTLRALRSERALRAFAGPDLLTQSRQYRLNLVAMAGLRQYARARAWSVYYRRTGQVTLARREAARAGVQRKRLRSL